MSEIGKYTQKSGYYGELVFTRGIAPDDWVRVGMMSRADRERLGVAWAKYGEAYFAPPDKLAEAREAAMRWKLGDFESRGWRDMKLMGNQIEATAPLKGYSSKKETVRLGEVALDVSGDEEWDLLESLAYALGVDFNYSYKDLHEGIGKEVRFSADFNGRLLGVDTDANFRPIFPTATPEDED